MDARCVENFGDVAGEFAAFAPHLVLMDISLPFAFGGDRLPPVAHAVDRHLLSRGGLSA